MKNKLLLLLLMISSGLLAQKLPREILYGQLVADTMMVDNVLITNKTTRLSAVSKKDGTFQINVRVKDTLIFSSLNFPPQSLVLNDADLKLKLLKIKIESRPNQLDEVVINPNALTGNLAKDNENINVTKINAQIDNSMAMATLYEDDSQTSPENKLMPGYLDTRYMMDFMAIGKKLFKALKKSDAEKLRNKDVTRFSVVVQNRFSDDFFRNNLKMNKVQTTAFLDFCEKDAKASKLLENGNDFELIDFLVQKKQEFMQIKKE